MTDAPAADLSEHHPRRSARTNRQPLWFPLSAALLAAALTLLCAAIAGGTLGMMIGALAVTTILTPTLSSGEHPGLPRLWLALGLFSGVALGLTAGAVQGRWGITIWMQTTLIIASYIIALLGVFTLLEQFRLPPTPASAAVTLLGLLWLFWPFWMAPWLQSGEDEQLVTDLARAHPILAVNGALRDTFPVPWAEARWTYRLTNIGDDVIYEMPTTLAWCIFIHALIGVLALVTTLLLPRLPRPRLTADSPAHPPAD